MTLIVIIELQLERVFSVLLPHPSTSVHIRVFRVDAMTLIFIIELQFPQSACIICITTAFVNIC